MEEEYDDVDDDQPRVVYVDREREGRMARYATTGGDASEDLVGNLGGDVSEDTGGSLGGDPGGDVNEDLDEDLYDLDDDRLPLMPGVPLSPSLRSRDSAAVASSSSTKLSPVMP